MLTATRPNNWKRLMPGGKRRSESWLSFHRGAVKVSAMNARPFVVAAALLAAACSPTPPGPQPNQTYFWAVTSSAVTFNDFCSDDMTFRMMNGPLAFMPDSFIIYKASSDGRKATLMTCTELDPNS